jgi:hypothetical protein
VPRSQPNYPHPKHWFGRLSPTDAARFIASMERVRQHDWSLITRTADSRLALGWAQSPGRQLPFGKPDETTVSALVTLNRQLSSAIGRRLRQDRICRACLLRTAAQALLDDDLELSKGLLRRLTDATVGFEALASLTDLHPKSLIRMLGTNGNPAARHMVAVLAQLARSESVRLTVS